MGLNIDILVSVVLAFIMFGIGLSTPAGSFKNIIVNPRAMITGLSSQMIGLPLLAFAIAFLSGLPPAFQAGIIILAACPGGTTSGFLTYLFRGEVALAISLTAINSLITLITIPLIVNLGLLAFFGSTTEIHLPIVDTLIKIFTVTILPAASGVLIRSWKPVLASRVEQPLKVIFSILFALILLVMLFAGEKEGGSGITMQEIFHLLPVLLIMNLLGFIMGFFSGRLPGLGYRTSFTIGIEVSMQNTTLAFLVGNTILHNHNMIKPALVYAMFSFITALIYSAVIKKLNSVPVFGEFRS
ncbi:MAG: bile acid:sodium symporter family protein [Bacteroidales bacterium]|jgi:BASS family bile acid:Na+ symporter|nr:bile acid:sodium symporter family protein [Bacteroidales bacterium]